MNMTATVDPIFAFLLGCAALGLIIGIFVLIGAVIIARAFEVTCHVPSSIPSGMSSVPPHPHHEQAS